MRMRCGTAEAHKCACYASGRSLAPQSRCSCALAPLPEHGKPGWKAEPSSSASIEAELARAASSRNGDVEQERRGGSPFRVLVPLPFWGARERLRGGGGGARVGGRGSPNDSKVRGPAGASVTSDR